MDPFHIQNQPNQHLFLRENIPERVEPFKIQNDDRWRQNNHSLLDLSSSTIDRSEDILAGPSIEVRSVEDIARVVQSHNSQSPNLSQEQSVLQDVSTSHLNCELDSRIKKLTHLIGSESDAKIIVKAFDDNKKCMPESGRTLIVHAYFRKKESQLMKNYHKQPLDDWIIDNEELKKVASTIEILFPTECADAYYSKFRVENGIRIPESGKLPNHFDYLKGKLRSKGILKPRSKSKKIDVVNNTVFSDSVIEHIRYLEIHSEDQETVKTYWSKTHQMRQNLLKVDKISVDDYLKKFKALREQLGQALIEIDFNLLYPNKEEALIDKWPKLKDVFLSQLNVSKLSVSERNYLDLLPTLNEDSQNAVIFYLLKKIIPCGKGNVGKRKRKGDTESSNEVVNPVSNEVGNPAVNENSNLVANDNANPDPNETTESLENIERLKNIYRTFNNDSYRSSYMLQVAVANEEDATLKKLKEFFLKEKLTVQPLTVITGSIVNVQKTYVVINDVWYKTESFLNSIALTFKAFYAFDCKYPEKAKNLWQFFQISVFEINCPTEKVGIPVRTLTKQAKLKLAEN